MTGRVLVTGATGFLGGAVCRLLARRGRQVTATGRSKTARQAFVREGVPFRCIALELPAEAAGVPRHCPRTVAMHVAASNA